MQWIYQSREFFFFFFFWNIVESFLKNLLSLNGWCTFFENLITHCLIVSLALLCTFLAKFSAFVNSTTRFLCDASFSSGLFWWNFPSESWVWVPRSSFQLLVMVQRFYFAFEDPLSRIYKCLCFVDQAFYVHTCLVCTPNILVLFFGWWIMGHVVGALPQFICDWQFLKRVESSNVWKTIIRDLIFGTYFNLLICRVLFQPMQSRLLVSGDFCS
jgi:hypothetical protein